MPAKVVKEFVDANVELDDWAREIIQSNGLPRWQTYLNFFSIDAAKAGFLTKSHGVWGLTSTGASALEGGPEELFKAANRVGHHLRPSQTMDKHHGRQARDSEVRGCSGRKEFFKRHLHHDKQIQRGRAVIREAIASDILIDGVRLAALMIEYNVGVSVARTFELKKIDSDFLAED